MFVANEEGEKRVSLTISAGLSIYDIYGQMPTANEGAKKTCMSRTYCKNNRHLSVCGLYRKRSNADSSKASSPSQLFPGGYAGV